MYYSDPRLPQSDTAQRYFNNVERMQLVLPAIYCMSTCRSSLKCFSVYSLSAYAVGADDGDMSDARHSAPRPEREVLGEETTSDLTHLRARKMELSSMLENVRIQVRHATYLGRSCLHIRKTTGH